MKPARPDDLPKAVHEGTMMVGDIEVRTYQLGDGRRVIHADDFHRLLSKLGLDLDQSGTR